MVDKYNAAEKAIKDLIEKRSQYDTQLNENNMVKAELAILDDDDIIYKKIGPVMVAQDLSDCKSNVDSRLDLISRTIKTCDEDIKKAEAHKQKVAAEVMAKQKEIMAAAEAANAAAEKEALAEAAKA